MIKSSKIARGGLYTALTILILYICSIAPTNKLTLLAVASAIIPLSILTIGIKYSFAVYCASGLLAVILGLNASAVNYILLFGVYGFIKYYVEALRKPVLEILLKLIFFICSAGLLYGVYSLLGLPLNFALNIFILSLIYIVFAFIYDYALTILINFIDTKFKGRV